MKLMVALLASAFAVLSWRSAVAAEPPAPDPEPWRFTIAPYAWAVGVTGSVTVRNQTIDTNASTIELIQKGNSLVGLMTELLPENRTVA